jgi:uncharacterized protein YerC
MRQPPMSMEERMTIAAKLQAAIYGRPAMTILQAAKESGVSTCTITRIIRGAVPSAITANRLLNLWSKP